VNDSAIELSQVLTFLGKIAAFIVIVYLAFQVFKRVAGLLVNLVYEPHTRTEKPVGIEIPDVPGLYVLSEEDSKFSVVSHNSAEESIRTTIRSLDWDGGFHSVFLVRSRGVSLEVGGSLDPDVGFSSAYRDRNNDDYRVIREAPASIQSMEDLLVSFHLGERRWEEMSDYEQISS